MIDVQRIVTVANRLAELEIEDAVFVGGAVVGLLLTDPAAPSTRYTEDVDLVVTGTSRAAYHRLEQRLRSAGYQQPPDGPICRWIIAGVAVDLMPDDESILGFSNRWYAFLGKYATQLRIAGGPLVKIVSATYMIATKLEAFRSRGEGNFHYSTDIGDIITVLDGRAEVVEEVLSADRGVKGYITESFRDLLASNAFIEAIPGHLMPDEAYQRRDVIILERMQRICMRRSS